MHKLTSSLVLGFLCSFSLNLPAPADFLSDVSDWDWQLPAMEVSDVSINGDSLAEAWKEMASSLLVRCNLYITPSVPDRDFSFSSERCSALELLDALSSHYGYQWAQDAGTGVIWIFPSDREIESILDTRVDVAASVIAAPMHSGILKPLQEALPYGGLFTQAWSDLWLSTFDYPVALPEGNYTVREILNRCCLWSPKQAYVVTEDPAGLYLMDVHLPFDTYPAPAPGALLFWKTVLGPLPGDRNLSAEDIGLAMRDPEPRTRWAARSYLGMCLESQAGMALLTDRIPSLQPGEGAAWEALGAAAAQNQRPDKFPVPKAIVNALRRHTAPDVLNRLSPEAALLATMATAAYTNDAANLERLTRLDEIVSEQVLFDLIRLANFSEIVFRALHDDTSEYYIGGHLEGLPEQNAVDFQKISVRPATRGESGD